MDSSELSAGFQHMGLFWDKQESKLMKQLLVIRDKIQAIEGSTHAAISRLEQWAIDGKFSSKSAYEFFRPRKIKLTWPKLVWQTSITPKHSFILWLGLKGRLLTRDKLQGYIEDQTCPLCREMEETIDHLFFQCRVGRQVWSQIKLWLGISRAMNTLKAAVKWMIKEARGTGAQAKAKRIGLACTNHNADTVNFFLDSGDTVLLRIINASLNQQLFFIVANHRLTVVGADAAYIKPFLTRTLMLGPGQTTDVLTADQTPGRYFVTARAYASAPNAPFDNTTETAAFEYNSAPCITNKRFLSKPTLPRLQAYNNTATATAFTTQFRSPFNVKMPAQIDENLFFTVGFGFFNCNPGPQCQGPNNTRFATSMNNVSFVLPKTTSLLQAYYRVYRASSPQTWTKLYKMKFGSKVQIVLQDTAIFSEKDHPMHIYGYSFYVVGQGFGNFNPRRDTAKFNLIDPPERNTIDVPVGGWAVIRIVADNPGVWLMHCPWMRNSFGVWPRHSRLSMEPRNCSP
ncbi:laccase 12 [Actinidia rufa]|uniref:Laccase 12 n=1 Tax=Actinidia rufa TaxID=165716 RepID=A0A7J0HA85_9ERIC|nr:laccase 12 [Actinidia rufa]